MIIEDEESNQLFTYFSWPPNHRRRHYQRRLAIDYEVTRQDASSADYNDGSRQHDSHYRFLVDSLDRSIAQVVAHEALDSINMERGGSVGTYHSFGMGTGDDA